MNISNHLKEHAPPNATHYKAKAKQNLLTKIVKLQSVVSNGWGENIITASSLEQHIRQIKDILCNHVEIELFTQEDMDEFMILINQTRNILRTRLFVEKLNKTLESNTLNTPSAVQEAIKAVIYQVEQFRYPTENLLKAIKENSND